MLIWKGPICHVSWPGHESIDLKVEIWGETMRTAFKTMTSLTFHAFADPNGLPLTAIQGPVMNVYSTDELTIGYFGELAASAVCLVVTEREVDQEASNDATLAGSLDTSPITTSTPDGAFAADKITGATAPDGKSKAQTRKWKSFDHLVFYCHKEKDAARVYVRPLKLERDLQYNIAVPKVSGGGNAAIATAGRSETPLVGKRHSQHAPIPDPTTMSARPRSPAILGINGPTKALQQLILAALRLRGIRRDHYEYKTLYYLCFKAVEFSLRNYPSPISLELMQEKVEALLSILEPDANTHGTPANTPP